MFSSPLPPPHGCGDGVGHREWHSSPVGTLNATEMGRFGWPRITEVFSSRGPLTPLWPRRVGKDPPPSNLSHPNNQFDPLSPPLNPQRRVPMAPKHPPGVPRRNKPLPATQPVSLPPPTHPGPKQTHTSHISLLAGDALRAVSPLSALLYPLRTAPLPSHPPHCLSLSVSPYGAGKAVPDPSRRAYMAVLARMEDSMACSSVRAEGRL